MPASVSLISSPGRLSQTPKGINQETLPIKHPNPILQKPSPLPCLPCTLTNHATRLVSYARRRRPPPAMPTVTSPLKRPSAGGRLRRLLASLRPPASAGPLPVQTGFPTSLADLVVKNHGRLKKPRRRHRATPAPPSVAASAAEPALQQRRDLSVPQQDAAVPAPPPARPKGAGFTVRPELLAVGGVMALVLLVIWTKRLVAAATLASVALFWIESVRSPAASRRRPRPEMEEDERNSRGRGLVSPIQEAAESPRPSSAPSDMGSEASSLWAADTTDEFAGDDPGSISPSKRKEKRRSLRKLLAKKLQNGSRRPKDVKDSHHGGESEHPGPGGEVSAPKPAAAVAPAEETVAPAPESVTDARRHRRRGGGALSFAAFVPVILVGLVAGKLPAVALTVLCAVFFTSVERAPES